jgi:hypothetical protein
MDEPSSLTAMTEQDRQISEIIAEERSRLRNVIRRRVPDASERKKLIWIAPLAIVGIAIFIALGGGAVMLLWNWLLPTLFGLRSVTFWQAIGLLALCRILFGGFRLGGGSPRSRMRRRMAERWEQMTPEERENLRQGFQGRCGRTAPLDSPPSA